MKKIAPFILVSIFFISGYLLYVHFIMYRQLSGIRNNNEIIRVINILDEKFHNYYRLPENENNLVRIGDPIANHDVDLSEEILEYLNANRNEWQYEYVKNPVKATNQDDYTLFHFNNIEGVANTFLDMFNSFNNDWQYYLVTENHNPLIERISEELYNTTDTMSKDYWELGFNTLWKDTTQHDSLQDNSYTAVLVYGEKVEYPNRILNIESDVSISNAIKRLGTLQYFHKNILNINRDTKTLQKIWNENSSQFYDYFSKTRYDYLIKPLIDNLLDAYNIVNQTNTYKEHFKKYNVDDPEFFALPGTDQYKTAAFTWPYSFWDRRFTEGNMEYIHTLLLEIKNHYE